MCMRALQTIWWTHVCFVFEQGLVLTAKFVVNKNTADFINGFAPRRGLQEVNCEQVVRRARVVRLG